MKEPPMLDRLVQEVISLVKALCVGAKELLKNFLLVLARAIEAGAAAFLAVLKATLAVA
jgi:hypothetical protein